MRSHKLFTIALLLAFLQGCASIIGGTSQTISVETNPPGASCKIKREGAVIASIEKTPGGALIEKTKHDLVIECEKAGYQNAATSVDSEIEGATFGNIVLGGGIGWAIDSASGADNKYAEYVTVSLAPESGSEEIIGFAAPKLPWQWKTKKNDTPAYSEFGGGGKSMRMPSMVPLTLIEKREDWGQFQFETQEGGKGRAWIALKDVIEVSAFPGAGNQ